MYGKTGKTRIIHIIHKGNYWQNPDNAIDQLETIFGHICMRQLLKI